MDELPDELLNLFETSPISREAVRISREASIGVSNDESDDEIDDKIDEDMEDVVIPR